jgi:hypothetical protein
MKLLLTGSYFFVIMCVVPTCSKNEIDCEDQPFTFATVGYTYEEMDKAIVRWYDHGTSFTNPVDSFQFYFLPHQYTKMGDTLRFNDFNYDATVGSFLPFTWRHDYEVYFPSGGKTYHIYSLRNEGRETGTMHVCGSSAGCTNRLVSYEIDGTAYQFKENDPSIFLLR